MPEYLIQPKGQGYSFVLAVPKDLRGRIKSKRTGRPLRKIVEGLDTDSLAKAKAKARERLSYWLTIFERRRQETELALTEIKQAADEHYTHTLRRMATDAEIMRDLFRGMSGRENDPEGDEIAWLTSGRDMREKGLAEGNYSLVVPEIEAARRLHGVDLDPQSPTYPILAKALLRAQAAAIEGRIRLLQGKPTEKPPSFLGSEGFDELTLKPKTLTGPMIRLSAEHGPWSLFEQWIAEAKPAPSTVNRWRVSFLDLQKRFKERDISEDDAREWARGLVTEKRSAQTVADIWVTGARTVYNWAVEQKRANSNPFAAVKVTVPEKIETRESKAFTDDEAATILRAALATEPGKNTFKAAKRWVPWLQGYSGARAGELTQLRGQDVFQQESMWVMKLTPDAGTVKTRKPRVVPLHEHIIAQGFLDYVKAHGSGPLFYNQTGRARQKQQDDATNPRRPRAVKTRERIAEWVRELGVNDPAVSPTHGWRHLFKQIAEGVGISERMSDYITGHAPASEGRKYGAPKVADVAAALEKFPRYSI